MRTYTFAAKGPRDQEPVFSRAIEVGSDRSAGLTVIVHDLQYEDPPGTVRATVQLSNDENNWTDFESFDVDGDVRVGTFSLSGLISTKYIRAKVSMWNGLYALVDVTLTLCPPEYVAP